MAEAIILDIFKAHGRRDGLIYIRHSQHTGIVIVECHPIKELVIASQRLVSVCQCFLIISHLQIDAGGKSMCRSLAGIEHVQCLLGQCGQCLIDILENEVVDLLYRGLCIRCSYSSTHDQGHTAIGGSRSCVVGLRIVVHQGEILHRTQNLCLSYNLCSLSIGGFGSFRCVFYNEVGSRNSGICVIICCLIALVHGNAVGTLIPKVIGIVELIVSKTASCDIAVIEQDDRLQYILTAVVVLVGKHHREVGKRGRYFLTLGQVAQVIITTAQACEHNQTRAKKQFIYLRFHCFQFLVFSFLTSVSNC